MKNSALKPFYNLNLLLWLFLSTLSVFTHAQQRTKFHIALEDFKSLTLNKSSNGKSFNATNSHQLLISKIHKLNIDTIYRTFPSAQKLSHPNAELLASVWTLEVSEPFHEVHEALSYESEEIFLLEEDKGDGEVLHVPNDYGGVDNNSSFWALDNINAPQAWDISTGVSGVKIAITDVNFLDESGYNNYHYENYGELIGKVDFFNGNIYSTQPGSTAHGCFVAAVAGGNTNNMAGTSSIGYDSRVLLYEAFDYDNFIDAVLKGARIINCSWLSRCSPSSSEQLVINTLTDLGVIFVAAAGNGTSGGTCNNDPTADVYPASYDNVISVTGYGVGDSFLFDHSGETHHLNYNQRVDISAPGDDVLVGVLGNPNYSAKKTGTSYAAPLVAGTIALMLDVNPQLTYKEVELILKTSADKSILNTSLHPENSPYVNGMGAGKLDAYKAVQMARDYDFSSYRVSWTNIDDVTIVDDDVIKTSGSTWWNAGAASMNVIPFGEGGWIEVTPNSVTGNRMFGLSRSDAGSSWNTIEHNFYLSNGTLKIYQSGNLIGSFGSYSAGDHLKITVIPITYQGIGTYTSISFSKNGTSLYSTPFETQNNGNYIADLSLYTIGSSIDNVFMSHQSYGPIPDYGNPVTWTNKTGVSSSGNTITKTNQTSWWNSGAASVQKISADHNGWMSVDAISTSDYRMIGLSPTDQGATWNTIKYNLYLRNDGHAAIYNSGNFIAAVGEYEIGDRFKVERRTISGNNYIIFSKNDIILHGWEISNAEMTEDLIVDACMYTPGGQLNNVRIEEGGVGQGGIAPPPGGSMTVLSSGKATFGSDTEEVEGFRVDMSIDSIQSVAEFIQKFDESRKFKNQVRIDSLVSEPNLTDSLFTAPDFNLTYYPNPVEHFLHLESSEKKDLMVSIHHFISGEELERIKLSGNRKEKAQKLNLSKLPAGIYIMKVSDGKHSADFRISKE